LTAVDHPDLEFVFEIASLRRAERVVENRERRAVTLRKFAHLGGFTTADKGARVDGLQVLLDQTGDVGASALGQRTEFGQRVFGAKPVRRTGLDPDQNCALGAFDGRNWCKTQKLTSASRFPSS
jgi:hypothetical protein